MADLTRWNRAGLSRFEYLEGNAALYLERLRQGLAESFPTWVQVQATGEDASHALSRSELAILRKEKLEALYAADPDDMLWQLTRQFARACHVMGVHIDAYANEGYLGTASQWENLRLLVEMLDYAPSPPASASTPLALFLKTGKSGAVLTGLQVKYNPTAGAPVVFETLADLEAKADFNLLYAKDHLRNPSQLSGSSLVLEGKLDKLKIGEPIVLEDERDGQLSAHLLEGVILSDDQTQVSFTPPLPAGLAKGHTLIHLSPKEKLKPLGPATKGVSSVGNSLQLAVSSEGLAAGDIVVIRSGDDKPYYRRIKAVHEDRLVFYREIGQITLAGATVANSVIVPLTDLAKPPSRRTIQEDGTVIDVVFAAGDWSRLARQWLAHVRKIADKNGEREYLPAYRCLHAKYVPVGTDPSAVEADERPGYTALTLAWHKDTDGVPGNINFSLNNPQTLLAPPPTAGSWIVDTFLNKSEKGHLVQDLVCEMPKQTVAGDLAVVVKGAQMAWAKLGTVALDQEHEESTLSAETAWQDRGGGPYFLSRTRVFGHFQTEGRVVDWQDNATALAGKQVPMESLPEGLKIGRALIVDNGEATMETKIASLETAGSFLVLADAVPDGTTHGNLKIYANVVEAGHGESRPEQVLGSGDGTLGNQHFTLSADNLSFIADATMSSGVRANLTVTVGGETWTQVSNLKDSAPTDAHYQVRIDQDGKADIQFGDGRHGRRLPTGGNNIRVSYRQGVGLGGNLDAGSLTKLAKPHPLLESVAQPIESSGGADREGNDDLRKQAPATLLALDRAVSLEDFSQLARGHASVWQAKAFRLTPGLGQRERLEVVVMAAGGGTPSAAVKQELQSYLLARAQPGVAITVSDYQRLTFKLKVTVRVRTDAFDKQTVADAVLEALKANFTEKNRQLGQALYRGEIYKVVDGVLGVENSDCSIELPQASGLQIVQAGGQILAVRPGPRQCLVLDSSGFVASVEEFEL